MTANNERAISATPQPTHIPRMMMIMTSMLSAEPSLASSSRRAMLPGDDGDFQMEADGLHIWPRGHFMLMALPNPDKTFTCTLFGPYEGPDGLDSLTDDDSVQRFFNTHFPDVVPLLPNLTEDWKTHPTSSLVMIRCNPWNDGDQVALMGDASHAIVPFYGQGMNASFEDVYVFNTVLDENLESWKAVFEKYQSVRKADTDAIADLAIDNYYEMRDHVADPVFKQKREVELLLEKECSKEYFSKYSMVTFKPDMGYDLAMRKGRAQDKAIVQLLKEKKISQYVVV